MCYPDEFYQATGQEHIQVHISTDYYFFSQIMFLLAFKYKYRVFLKLMKAGNCTDGKYQI